MRLRVLVPILFVAGFAASYAVASPHALTALVKTRTTKNEKVALCHKTGMKGNPPVTIRVARHAMKAHLWRGDTMGPCHAATTSTSTSTTASTSTSPTELTITICHKTGSASNPFVKITVSQSALDAHRRHGDIVPAPAGGCPTPSSTTMGGKTKGRGR